MLDVTYSIDQALFNASLALNYARPALICPYVELDKKPTANIMKLLARIGKEVVELERRFESCLQAGEELRISLAQDFATNKEKIEPRHLDNLRDLATLLEKTAEEFSEVGVTFLKRERKIAKILAQENPGHKKEIQCFYKRIESVKEKTAEEVFEMALFLRVLRAEYSDNSVTKNFTDAKDMRIYLSELASDD